MQYKDCVLQVIMPWYSEDGQEISVLRLDARGTKIDRRAVRRIVRKWYKQALGRSLHTSLLKDPKFLQIIVHEENENFDNEKFNEDMNRWLQQIEAEVSDEDEDEGHTQGNSGDEGASEQSVRSVSSEFKRETGLPGSLS